MKRLVPLSDSEINIESIKLAARSCLYALEVYGYDGVTVSDTYNCFLTIMSAVYGKEFDDWYDKMEKEHYGE